MDGAYVTKRFERENKRFPDVSEIRTCGRPGSLQDSTVYRVFFYGANPYHGSKRKPLGGPLEDFAVTKTARNNTRLLEGLRFQGRRLGNADLQTGPSG